MNESTPKISVIVPVYKAEAYLHRCVDSLLVQTFLDFEVLLVDDGSPDRSGEICDEYAHKDGRVRVFHKKNGGVSSARQCGMDNAQGEYTIHADPDDWVEPDMLEELYRKAKEEDVDMVICDFYEEMKDKTIYVCQQPSSLDHETVLCELFQQLHGSCWNKLVRRACYKEFGVRFPEELSFCEDLYVNACLVSRDIKIAYVDQAFYHYDQYTNEASLVHRPLEKNLQQEVLLYCLLQEKLDTYFPQISQELLYRQSYKVLHIGKTYLDTFQSDYSELKPFLSKRFIPLKTKILYWVAFNLSPKLVYYILRLHSRLRFMKCE